MKKRDIKNIKEYIFSIGCGGLLLFWGIQIAKLDIPEVSEGLKKLVETEQFSKIQISFFEIIIFAISFLLIVIAPMLCHWNKQTAKKITALIVITFLFLVGCVIVVVNGNISNLFLIVGWVFFSLLCYMGIDILKIIKLWLHEETKQNYDIAKLTLVWTVLAFLLGRLF